jgi:hypothetical protein
MINLIVDGFFILLFIFVFGTIIYYNIDQTTKYRKK